MNKQLTSEQSLDIITLMIERTRNNFSNRGGAMFLIWGYTTVVVTALVTTLFLATGSSNVLWLWWLLPIVGGVGTWLHLRRRPRLVTTHLDRAVWSVWIAAGVACWACAGWASVGPQVADLQSISILFIIALVICVATAATGLVIGFRPVSVGGFVGMALAFGVLAAGNTIWQLPIFAVVFVVAQIVPGHLLARATRREARAEVEENGGASDVARA